MQPPKSIKRKIEATIDGWIRANNRESLLITGARQVGKTYSIEHVLQSSDMSHVTLNFELNPSLKQIFETDSDVDRIMSAISVEFPDFRLEPGNTVLFFDEIQSCPSARRAIKQFVNDGRYRIIASGSLMGLQYRSTIQNPVGYERSVEMRSLDFEEFLWAIGINEDLTARIRNDIRDRRPMEPFIASKIDYYFTLFMVVGGMPGVVSDYLRSQSVSDAINAKRRILDGYRADIGKYSLPGERDRIYRVFDSIPYILSQESKKFVYSKLESDDSPVFSARNCSEPIQWLIDSGIVRKCTQVSDPRLPLERTASDRSFKLYMEDTGLLLGMMDPEVTASIIRGDRRVNRGAIMENAVAEGLSKCGHRLFYFASKNMEIDFIMTMKGSVAVIEVKSGNNNRSKSLNSMKEKYDVGRRIKLENTEIRVTDDGIEHYPLFASAFVDSMYDKPTLEMKLDPDGMNSINAKMD